MQKIIRIKRGIDVKLSGKVLDKITRFDAEYHAIKLKDFSFLTPKLLISIGDKVKIGTSLFHDKERETVTVVSPISGVIHEIRRGDKRHIESIIIKNDFLNVAEPIAIPETLLRQEIITTLLQSGLWALLRQRPFDIIPNPEITPRDIFVSTFDSAPLAPDFAYMLQGKEQEFYKGLSIIRHLTEGKLYLSLNSERDNTLFEKSTNVLLRYFKGKHPVGNIGTQIHHIAPLNKGEVVWHLNPWQVMLIGHFFLHKELSYFSRIALCGSEVLVPQYYEIIMGASLSKVVKDNISDKNVRVISGNILTGKQISLDEAFVGYYDRQVTVIQEGGKREFLGWLLPGLKKWSFSHTFLAFLVPKKEFNFHTSLQGGRRTLMMNDWYDKVFPFDILPVELYKACKIKDVELMEKLGIYELTGEDMALCELICPSKIEWQQAIQEGLSVLFYER